MNFKNHNNFWSKIGNSFTRVGRDLMVKVLTLYFTMMDKDTPYWAKATIASAIVYFINIADAIPDVAPVVGYTDDISVIAAALATVGIHIKPEHIERAKQKAEMFFG